MMYLIFDILKRIFYPDDFGCAVCRKRGEKYGIYGDIVLCDECAKSFKRVEGTVCVHCGRKVGSEDSLCKMCAKHDFVFEGSASLFEYDGEVRTLMHKLKYSGEQWIAEYLGKGLAEKYRELGWNIDIVTYVPMYHAKERKRGYNQAQLIAKVFSDNTNLYLSDPLVRTKNTTPQSKLDETERISNLADAIVVKREYRDVVFGKNVLVIDDIQTTGTSLNECAKVLLAAGAAKVYGLCACSVSD